MSFKKIILITSIFSISSFLSATVYFPQEITAYDIQAAPASKIEVAWDIHDTIAKKISGNVFRKIGIGVSYAFGNDAWEEIHNASKYQHISGEGMSLLCIKNGHPKLAKMIEKEANAYKPRKGMAEFIRRIDSAGITQRFASNIGPRFLANMDRKFKTKDKCFIFDIIKPGKIVDYNPLGGLPSVVQPHLTTFCKPYRQFYQEYCKAWNPKKEKYTIFIDDKLENVQMAVQEGFIGIHFDITKKHPLRHLTTDFSLLRKI